jgi:UDPglucose 6-dehydrogenase
VTVSVLGTGYVGLTTATLLAHSGHTVYAVEPNPERLNVIKAGRSFFFEEGLDPLVHAAVEKSALIPTDSYEESVPKSDIVFSCVGTPDNPDGSSNLTYVFAAAEGAITLMKPHTIYVQKSTVPVGTGEKIEKLFTPYKKDVTYVSNPEFLREGTALADSLYFDRIVTGGNNKKAVETIIDLYKSVEESRNAMVALAGIKSLDTQGSYIRTSRNSAELIKVTSNAFLSVKISFANSIAKLADKTGADINEVMDAVGSDPRIGRAFLNAGRGYGGGCFPKDVSGLIASGLEFGVDLEIMQATQAVNRSMPGYILEKLQQEIDSFNDKKVAVLGLAFKTGTSDARRSPGVKLANLLFKMGATVTAYDPEASEEAAHDLKRGVTIEKSLEKAIKDADAIVVATDWPELVGYDLTTLTKNMRGTYFVDAVNAFDIPAVEAVGLRYIGVGRNGEKNG